MIQNLVAASSVSTATLAGVPSSTAHEHQTRKGDASARHSLPAAYEPQACELGRGVDPRSLSRISHRLDSSPSRRPVSRTLPHRGIGQTLRVRAVTGCASPFHSVRFVACKRSSGHSVAHQQPFKHFGDAPHVSSPSWSVSLRPHHIGRRQKGWRYLISVMRCPK